MLLYCGYPQVKHIMQIHIRQNRGYLPTLWCPLITFMIFCSFHDSRNQKPLYITQKIFVINIICEKLHHPVMIYIIKESSDVCFQHIINLSAHYHLIDICYCVMSTAIRAESHGTVKKSWLVYLIQYICHCSLYKSVLISWYSQRSHFPIAFVDIGSAYW